MMLTTMMLIHMMMIIIVIMMMRAIFFFRYQIMRNCWQEQPDDRPSFEQLRHELKQMANQHKVIYRNFILYVEYLFYNVCMN